MVLAPKLGADTDRIIPKGADYFKTGISVALPTDWRDYDSIYPERYVGKPDDRDAVTDLANASRRER